MYLIGCEFLRIKDPEMELHTAPWVYCYAYSRDSCTIIFLSPMSKDMPTVEWKAWNVTYLPYSVRS